MAVSCYTPWTRCLCICISRGQTLKRIGQCIGKVLGIGLQGLFIFIGIYHYLVISILRLSSPLYGYLVISTFCALFVEWYSNKKRMYMRRKGIALNRVTLDHASEALTSCAREVRAVHPLSSLSMQHQRGSFDALPSHSSQNSF